MKRERVKIGLVSKMFLLVAAFCLVSSCGDFARLMQKGGTLLSVEVKTDEPDIDKITDQAVKIMRNRLNALGVDGEVEKTVANRLEIKIYGDADIQRLKQILLAEGRFELRRVVSPPSPAPMQTYPTKEEAVKSLGGRETDTRKVLPFKEREPVSPINSSRQDNAAPERWLVVENPPVVDGSELRDASVYKGADGDYSIMFSLNAAGAQKLGDWTGKNINSYLAIVLNDEVKSAPYIKSQIFDSGQIDGRFTKAAAEDLVLVMKSGYLPATFQLVDERKFE